MKDKFVHAHMKCAYVYGQLSYCERLKVGCVIVKDNRIISIGYNGTPPGQPNVCECENNSTLPTVLHAELNAIAKLAKSNESGDGATAFVTHAPCLPCSLLIKSSGIKEVFYTEAYRITDGIDFLQDNGVKVQQVNKENVCQQINTTPSSKTSSQKKFGAVRTGTITMITLIQRSVVSLVQWLNAKRKK